MEKLYRQITETQRINQKVKLHGTVTADLRINTFKKHDCFAAFISCFVYLFIVRLERETGSAQGPTSGRAGSSTSPSGTRKVQSAQLGQLHHQNNSLHVLTRTLTDNW